MGPRSIDAGVFRSRSFRGATCPCSSSPSSTCSIARPCTATATIRTGSRSSVGRRWTWRSRPRAGARISCTRTTGTRRRPSLWLATAGNDRRPLPRICPRCSRSTTSPTRARRPGTCSTTSASPTHRLVEEAYGEINFMARGIYHATMINTVSPTYAREILTREGGASLDGLLRHRQLRRPRGAQRRGLRRVEPDHRPSPRAAVRRLDARRAGQEQARAPGAGAPAGARRRPARRDGDAPRPPEGPRHLRPRRPPVDERVRRRGAVRRPRVGPAALRGDVRVPRRLPPGQDGGLPALRAGSGTDRSTAAATSS